MKTMTEFQKLKQFIQTEKAKLIAEAKAVEPIKLPDTKELESKLSALPKKESVVTLLSRRLPR